MQDMEITVSEPLAQQAPGALSQQERVQLANAFGFSPQQMRVVELVVQGRGDKEIARQLNLSFGTVRAYLSRAFERTGVSGRMELAASVFARLAAMRTRPEDEQR